MFKDHMSWIIRQKIEEIIIKQLESYLEFNLPVSSKNLVTRLCNLLMNLLQFKDEYILSYSAIRYL